MTLLMIVFLTLWASVMMALLRSSHGASSNAKLELSSMLATSCGMYAIGQLAGLVRVWPSQSQNTI